MKRHLALTLAVALAAIATPRIAAACGGYGAPAFDTSQVRTSVTAYLDAIARRDRRALARLWASDATVRELERSGDSTRVARERPIAALIKGWRAAEMTAYRGEIVRVERWTPHTASATVRLRRGGGTMHMALALRDGRWTITGADVYSVVPSRLRRTLRALTSSLLSISAIRLSSSSAAIPS